MTKGFTFPHVFFSLRDDKEVDDKDWDDPMEIRTDTLDLIHMSATQVRIDRVAGFTLEVGING